MTSDIDMEKLHEFRSRHEQLRADYAYRVEQVRVRGVEVAEVRDALVRATKSEAARELLHSNPAEIATYSAEALQLSNIDPLTLRRLLALLATLSRARQDADAQALSVRESATLLERVNTYAKQFPGTSA